MPRQYCKRTPLTMMRTRGVQGPTVKRGKFAASPTKRTGVKPVGGFIIFKQLNP